MSRWPRQEASHLSQALPLRKLSGARGTMLAERLRLSMESSPHDYNAATECLAAQLVGDHVSGPVRIRCRSAMEGARTTQAAAHPLALCQEVAKVIEAVAKVRHAAQGIEQTAGGLKHEPEVGDVRDHKGGAQRFVSHFWAAQLAESLHWRTILGISVQAI